MSSRASINTCTTAPYLASRTWKTSIIVQICTIRAGIEAISTVVDRIAVTERARSTEDEQVVESQVLESSTRGEEEGICVDLISRIKKEIDSTVRVADDESIYPTHVHHVRVDVIQRSRKTSRWNVGLIDVWICVNVLNADIVGQETDKDWIDLSKRGDSDCDRDSGWVEGLVDELDFVWRTSACIPNGADLESIQEGNGLGWIEVRCREGQ